MKTAIYVLTVEHYRLLTMPGGDVLLFLLFCRLLLMLSQLESILKMETFIIGLDYEMLSRTYRMRLTRSVTCSTLGFFSAL